MEKQLAREKGIFKTKQSKKLQTQIENMKRYLPTIVQEYESKNVKGVPYRIYRAEYGDYRKAVTEWEKLTGEK